MRLFSYRDRLVHLGAYPLERLRRTTHTPNDSALPPMQALRFEHDDPESMAHAMAHRLHALGKPFDFHDSASRTTAGFLKDLAEAPWAQRVQYHFKDEGQRADLMQLLPDFAPGQHVYTCGAPRFMDGVFEAAAAHGWPQDALHRQYLSVPKADAWVNQPFELLLQKSGYRLQVPAERSATDVLAEAGVAIDVKCSDGLCGVCARPYDAKASDAVEHRDFVLLTRPAGGGCDPSGF